MTIISDFTMLSAMTGKARGAFEDLKLAIDASLEEFGAAADSQIYRDLKDMEENELWTLGKWRIISANDCPYCDTEKIDPVPPLVEGASTTCPNCGGWLD